MKMLNSGFDTESVRQMVETAKAAPVTIQDVYNLARRGALLDGAQIRPGFFDKARTARAVKTLLRRRLLEQLGRINPRMPGSEFDTTCHTCNGQAVKWEGRWLCENGHGGTTNE